MMVRGGRKQMKKAILQSNGDWKRNGCKVLQGALKETKKSVL